MTKSGLEAAQTWSFATKYWGKMEKWDNKTYDYFVEATSYRPEEFNVFSHSELWVNNQMYKYDGNGRPEDVIFVSIYLKIGNRLLGRANRSEDFPIFLLGPPQGF